MIAWLNGPALVRIIPSAILFGLVVLLLVGDHWLTGAGRAAGTSNRPVIAWRRAYIGLLIAAIATGTVIVARAATRAVSAPQSRDVGAFWRWGRMVDGGGDPYLPNAWQAHTDPAAPLPADPQAKTDGTNAVRGLYPPLVLPLFAAVGWLPLRAAAVTWLAGQLLCLFGSVLLLARLFWPESGGRGLALALALTLLLPATWFTIDMGQTHFLVLLLLLATWRVRDRPVSGAYVGAAAIVRPLCYIFVIYPFLFRGRWRTVSWTALTVAACCLATVAAFGAPTFLDYFRADPFNHLGPAYFSLGGSQSLLALMVSLRHGSAVQSASLFDPGYLVAAGLVLGIAVWTIARIPRTRRAGEIAMGILLTTGLLIYPATQPSSSVLLLPPISLLWAMRGDRPRVIAWTSACIGLVYALTCYHRSQYSIVANILVWLVLVGIALSARATDPMPSPTYLIWPVRRGAQALA